MCWRSSSGFLAPPPLENFLGTQYRAAEKAIYLLVMSPESHEGESRQSLASDGLRKAGAARWELAEPFWLGEAPRQSTGAEPQSGRVEFDSWFCHLWAL